MTVSPYRCVHGRRSHAVAEDVPVVTDGGGLLGRGVGVTGLVNWLDVHGGPLKAGQAGGPRGFQDSSSCALPQCTEKFGCRLDSRPARHLGGFRPRGNGHFTGVPPQAKVTTDQRQTGETHV